MTEEVQYQLRGYILFWFGQLVSLAGTNIVNFSLVWWITVQTNSAFMLGLSAFLGFGSFILVTPFAGVFVDRWSRKKVIATADSLLALLTFILVLLFAFGIANIVHVLMIQLIGGMLGSFHQTAVQAIIPIMVPKKHLSRMNSLQYFATSLIQTAGPALGALVYTFFLGVMAQILWIDILTYLVAIIPTILIFIPSIKPKEKVEKPSFRTDFAEGLGFIRERPGLLTLLSMFTVANFLLPPAFILLPLYSTRTLAFGNQNLGILLLAALMSFQNLSMMGASALMSVLKGFKRNTFGVVTGLFAGASGMVILALTPPGFFWMAAAGIIIMGLTIPIANISSQTIWQKVVPAEKLGRVFSVRLTIAQFTGPFAFLVGGIIAEVLAIPVVFLIFGVLMIFFLIGSWTLTSLPRVEDQLEEYQPIEEEKNEDS
jgi:DHA3 family macrolide efflux protein-like MFS transporter